MNKLIIVRHGQSVENARNIIQGKTDNYGLTNEGKKAIQLKIQENMDILKDATSIITSPQKRAVETATIIADKINSTININENITLTYTYNIDDIDINKYKDIIDNKLLYYDKLHDEELYQMTCVKAK